MRYLILIFLFITLSLESQDIGGDYYVATDGNDGAAGTYAAPWLTITYAATQATAGDTVYIREGTYQPAGNISISNSGTDGNPICFFNYPDENPIIDYGHLAAGDWGYNFRIWNVSWIHIKGIRIQNMWEPSSASSIAFYCYQSSNIIIERCEAFVIGGTGFGTINSDSIIFINNDAYACIDSSGAHGNADGFRVWENVNDTTRRNFFRGNRAWECRDDGFDTNENGYVEFSDNWTWGNQVVNGGGAGMKYGIADVHDPTTLRRYIVNNISAFNLNGAGYNANDDGHNAKKTYAYNNISYANAGYGFVTFSSVDTAESVFSNNISYKDTINTHFFTRPTTEQTNSWDGATVSDADFLSVDSTGMSGARQSDGSLPELDFLKLTDGSSLIDAGTDVGESYNGTAPDIGYWESDYNTFTTPIRFSPSGSPIFRGGKVVTK